MPVCELSDSCLFFNDKMPDMPAVADFLKDKYCRGDFNACARYLVYKEFGRSSVPNGLFPNEAALLPEITAELKRTLSRRQ